MPTLAEAMAAGYDTEYVGIGDWSASGVDAYGVLWEITEIDGWWNGYTSDGQASARAADIGAWPDPVWAGPRVVNVAGTIEAPTWDDATLALERLIGQIPVSYLAPVVIFTGKGTVPAARALVRQANIPQLGARFGGNADFSVSLLAPDPRRYGVDEVTATTGLPATTGGFSLPITLPLTVGATVASGQMSVVNAGNADSPAVLEVAGPCPPCTITHIGSGRVLSIPEEIPAGRVLVLDTDQRTARLDGVADRTVTGSWWRLDPGVNEVAFGSVTYDAAAQLTIRYRHAWR